MLTKLQRAPIHSKSRAAEGWLEIVRFTDLNHIESTISSPLLVSWLEIQVKSTQPHESTFLMA